MEYLAVIIAASVGFLVSLVSGKFLIPYLRKLKFGQTILDIGPRWHKSKQGTPTMGGIMFILGVVIAVVVAWFSYEFFLQSSKQNIDFMEKFRENTPLFAGLIMALAFAFVGFVDDYIKVVKKQNLGLTAIQKLVMQILIAIFYITTMYMSGQISTVVSIPFIIDIDFGIFYYPLSIILILFVVNAVNLTDGIDGLCSTVTCLVSLAMIFIFSYLNSVEMNILSGAVAGGMIGFLIYNFYPARVFMGDTGSMFLGGIVLAYVYATKQPLLIILVGVIYIIEALSVVIQVTYFKITKGKRLFKMTPIHHHFEMSKYSETKIVVLFSIVTIIGSIAGVYFIIGASMY